MLALFFFMIMTLLNYLHIFVITMKIESILTACTSIAAISSKVSYMFCNLWKHVLFEKYWKKINQKHCLRIQSCYAAEEKNVIMVGD